MKNIYILLFVLSALVFQSCNQLDKFTQKEFQFSTDFTVPQDIEANKAYSILSEPIEVNLEEKLNEYSSNKDLIEEVLIKKLILNIDESSDKTFGFLKEIEVFIKTDNHGKVKVASVSDIDSNIGQELEVDVDKELDFSKYLKEEFLTMEISGIAKEAIDEEVLIKADLTYWVDFKVLGN